MPKYIFSSTLEKAEWNNGIVLAGCSERAWQRRLSIDVILGSEHWKDALCPSRTPFLANFRVAVQTSRIFPSVASAWNLLRKL